VAKIVQVTQANGNPALINADAVTLVITPPEAAPTGARAIVYMGSQQLAVRESVAEVKALL
jgi:uncharacterized protein YlzI (FlbEa/FlbD family)